MIRAILSHLIANGDATDLALFLTGMGAVALTLLALGAA